MRQAALPGSRRGEGHSLQVLDTCTKGKQGMREEVFPACQRLRLICMPVCLNVDPAALADWCRQQGAENKVGRMANAKKHAGGIEGDVGNSAPR